MSLWDLSLDRYTLLARQRPALFMLFPALVAAVVVFPSLQSWWAALIAVSGACGVSIALSEFAQGQGKALEPHLVDKWGGLPSVAMLRHRDGRIDTATKARYKAVLEKKVSGLRFPDAAAETNDPALANDAYYSATRWLLSQTRDKKIFYLLFQQNINYGYRRNMLGLKSWGIGVSVAALVALAGHTAIRPLPVAETVVIAIIVCAAILAYWLIAVRPDWVKTAANAYAFELLAACDRAMGESW